MDITKYIDDKTILIMPYGIKRKLLQNNRQLINIKSLTKNDLQKKVLFDYDEQTIHYLMKKYNLKYDVALMYLTNMYYVDEKTYDSDKLNKLVSMKQDLLDQRLLIKNDYFLKSIENFKVVVYSYHYIDRFFQKLLDIVGQHATVQIIDSNENENNNIAIYAFNDIEAEINFVAYSICQLIDEGININKIKIANINDDYLIPLKRIFSFYKIPLNLNERFSIYGTELALSFIDFFKENHSLSDSLSKLGDLYDLNDSNNLNIYNQLANLCNNYFWYEKNIDDITDMLINSLKNTYLKTPKVTNAIDSINLKDNFMINDEYVFVMNFNQEKMPLIYKNEDYITDDLATILNLEITSERNKAEYQTCLKIIKGLSHVIVTYKLKTKSSLFYPSSLIDELGIRVIDNPSIRNNISYSKIQDELELSKKLDKLIKYDDLEDETSVLYHNYSQIAYQSYDNAFKGIDNQLLLTYLSPKLKLSYSSIDDYFKCAFKYYISNVLNFKEREETFYLTIGNLFHYVLSLAFKPNFDFDEAWTTYLSDKKLSNKEKFFLRKLHDELDFIIKTIANHNRLSTLNKALYEQKIYINLPNKIDVSFSGVVDKIMYKESDKTLISLVDYKTGNTDINIHNAIHGLNMQLPIYLYLVKNSYLFKDPIFVGFYLQEVLHNEIYNDHTKEYEDKKRDALKLKGYTIDQEELIEQFDASYKDSLVIKSMKLSSNGFYKYSKILNNDQINNLISLVGDKISEGATDILNGKFDINPKKLDGTNVACEYCTFRDMCYMKDRDIITLKENKDLAFLGGDNHE